MSDEPDLSICPKCGCKMTLGPVGCPDKLDGCCAMHYGWTCFECMKIKVNTPMVDPEDEIDAYLTACLGAMPSLVDTRKLVELVKYYRAWANSGIRETDRSICDASALRIIGGDGHD